MCRPLLRRYARDLGVKSGDAAALCSREVMRLTSHPFADAHCVKAAAWSLDRCNGTLPCTLIYRDPHSSNRFDLRVMHNRQASPCASSMDGDIEELDLTANNYDRRTHRTSTQITRPASTSAKPVPRARVGENSAAGYRSSAANRGSHSNFQQSAHRQATAPCSPTPVFRLPTLPPSLQCLRRTSLIDPDNDSDEAERPGSVRGQSTHRQAVPTTRNREESSQRPTASRSSTPTTRRLQTPSTSESAALPEPRFRWPQTPQASRKRPSHGFNETAIDGHGLNDTSGKRRHIERITLTPSPSVVSSSSSLTSTYLALDLSPAAPGEEVERTGSPGLGITLPTQAEFNKFSDRIIDLLGDRQSLADLIRDLTPKVHALEAGFAALQRENQEMRVRVHEAEQANCELRRHVQHEGFSMSTQLSKQLEEIHAKLRR